MEMEPTTQPPFTSPPSHAVLAEREPSQTGAVVKVVLGIVVAVVWVGSVGIGWLMATIYAADTWGGGWLFGSGIREPFYDDAILLINVGSIILLMLPVIGFGVWSYRKH